MAYCKNCGQKLEEGSLFCSKCGQNIATVSENTGIDTKEVSYTATPSTTKNKFHCPKCKGTHLQTQTQTDFSQNIDVSQKGYSGGKGCLGYMMLGPLGLLCGLCGQKQEVKAETSQTSKSYWVCSDCGHKFRHIDELVSELEVVRRRANSSAKGLFIAFGISAFLDLLLYTPFDENFGGFMFWMIGLIITFSLGAVALTVYFDSKSASKEYWVKEEELKKLKKDTGYIE